MSAILRREIEGLKQKILSLSAIVEENVWRAVKSVQDRDPDLAERVIASDSEIDATEVVIEEEVLKILALHQPVAIDLRYIVAILKINNDLERVGDMAVRIARSSGVLVSQPRVDVPFDFPPMADKARSMLKRSLDALVNLDAELAVRVRADDEEVDALDRELCEQVKEAILRQPGRLDALMEVTTISRALERIADLACNITEEVIYMAQGQIIRRRGEEPQTGEG